MTDPKASRAKDAPKPPGGGANGGGWKLGDRKLTDETVIEALAATGGVRAAAARRLNVATSTLYAFLAQRRPVLEERIRQVDEEVGDFVEGKLLAAIRKDDIRAITFFCSTRLKHRGYTNRTETVGADGGPLLVQVAQPSTDDMLTLLRKLSAEQKAKQEQLQ